MRLEKFVGLLRRLLWLTGLAVAVVYHDPRSLYQNDDVHPEAQCDISSSSPVIAVKSPSFSQRATCGAVKRKAGTSPKPGAPHQAGHGYDDRCKTNARTAMGFEGQPWRFCSSIEDADFAALLLECGIRYRGVIGRHSGVA